MSDKPTGRGPQPTDSHRGLRLLALTAVVLGLLVLVAAAFVLSYAGIHVMALSVGVSPRWARLYPLILDAMLVIAFAAVLSLRGGGVFSRLYAWLSMLVLLAAAAAAGAAHATNAKLPHKPAAAVAAIIPWALVLIGFSLLLTMLRQARLRRQVLAAAQESATVEPAGHVVVRTGIDDLLSPKRPADAPAVRYGSGPGPAKADPAADPGLDLAIDTEPGQDDPASDEAHVPAPADGSPNPRGSHPAAAFSPAPTVATESESVTDQLDSGNSPASTSGAEKVPTARPASSNGSRPAARPTPKPTAARGTIPEARVAPEDAPVIPTLKPNPAEPEPTAESDAAAEPASPPVAQPDPEPAEDAESVPEAEAAPDPKPQREPKPTSGPEPTSEAGPEPTSEAGPEPTSEAGPEPTSEAGPEPTSEAGPAAEAPPKPPRFDRVRSSPEPPEA